MKQTHDKDFHRIGISYYCSDKYLHKKYSISEWNDFYVNGEGDSWTNWEMNKITYEEAKRTIRQHDLVVYCMYKEGSIGLAEHMDDIVCHEGTNERS